MRTLLLRMPQWLAVRISGRSSCAVLLTSEPLHRLTPAVDSSTVERISLRQALPALHTTSMLQLPESLPIEALGSTPPAEVRLRKPWKASATARRNSGVACIGSCTSSTASLARTTGSHSSP